MSETGFIASCREGATEGIIQADNDGELLKFSFTRSFNFQPRLNQRVSYIRKRKDYELVAVEVELELSPRLRVEEKISAGSEQSRIYFAYVDGKLYRQNTAAWFDIHHPRLGRGKDTLGSRGPLVWKSKILGKMTVCEDPRRKR